MLCSMNGVSRACSFGAMTKRCITPAAADPRSPRRCRGRPRRMIGHQRTATSDTAPARADERGDHQHPQRRNPDGHVDVRGAVDDAGRRGEQSGHVEIRAECEHAGARAASAARWRFAGPAMRSAAVRSSRSRRRSRRRAGGQRRRAARATDQDSPRSDLQEGELEDVEADVLAEHRVTSPNGCA